MLKRELPRNFSFGNLFGQKLPGKLPEKYPYFADTVDLKFQEDSDEFNIVNAWWLAEAALLAYVREENIVDQCLKEVGLQAKCFNFDIQGTQCFVAHNDKVIIVCFRGTEVEEPKDVWNDINFRPVDSGQAGNTFVGGRIRIGGLVHRGFKEALGQVWVQLEEYLRGIHLGQKVWFTGHSLGAPIAILAADRYDGTQGVYTFGSPGVGDDNFINDFPVKNNSYRFVNNNDVVTRVAPELFGQNVFGHVGQLKYIDRNGDIHDELSGWALWMDGVAGFFSHLGDAAKQTIKQGSFDQLPVDHLTDHAPINYAIHIWNKL